MSAKSSCRRRRTTASADASPTPARSSSSCAAARRSPAYARQYSEASTAAVGGDLGWVRPEQLPAPLAACASRRWARARSASRSRCPAAYSIIAVQDTRKILTADPRDAVLSLKQVSISFPKARPATGRGTDASRGLPKPHARSAAAAAPTRSRTEFHGEVVQQRPESRCATFRPPCSR